MTITGEQLEAMNKYVKDNKKKNKKLSDEIKEELKDAIDKETEYFLITEKVQRYYISNASYKMIFDIFHYAKNDSSEFAKAFDIIAEYCPVVYTYDYDADFKACNIALDVEMFKLLKKSLSTEKLDGYIDKVENGLLSLSQHRYSLYPNQIGALDQLKFRNIAIKVVADYFRKLLAE